MHVLRARYPPVKSTGGVVVRTRGALLRDEPSRVGVQSGLHPTRLIGVAPGVVAVDAPSARAYVVVAILDHGQDGAFHAVPSPVPEARVVPLPDDEPEPAGGLAPQLDAPVLTRRLAQPRYQRPSLAVVQDTAYAQVPGLGDDLHGDHGTLEQLGDVMRGILLEFAAELGGENHQQVRRLPHDGRSAVRNLRGEGPAEFTEQCREAVPFRGAAQE